MKQDFALDEAHCNPSLEPGGGCRSGCLGRVQNESDIRGGSGGGVQPRQSTDETMYY